VFWAGLPAQNTHPLFLLKSILQSYIRAKPIKVLKFAHYNVREQNPIRYNSTRSSLLGCQDYIDPRNMLR
jgi:hypothetical protein